MQVDGSHECGGIDMPSREDFLWGYSVFSSRAFPYALVDPTSTDQSEVLFPLVDALNHKPNTKITWSRNGDPETGSLSFVAGQAYNAGDEIFNNYGPKVSQQLLFQCKLTRLLTLHWIVE